MARRAAVTARRGSPARRKLVWARSFATNTFDGGANRVWVNLLEGFETDYGAQLIGATVIRIRGLITAFPTGATVDTSAVAGVRIHHDAATASGQVGPITNPYADWMAYEPFTFFGPVSGAVTLDNQQVGVGPRMIDFKSSRKLEEIDQQLTMCYESSGQTWEFHHRLSVLLMLP